MTISYSHEVATGGNGFGNFAKLLTRWGGSIYKVVLPDLGLYTVLYYIINISYRVALSNQDEAHRGRNAFHALVQYSIEVANVIPLQFVLGFYVSQVVTRWWNQYLTIPWPDTLAVSVAVLVRGNDERGRLMRRTILRYMNTSLVMIFSMISPQAKERFPELDNLVEAGFLVPHEKYIIDHLNEISDGPKYYVPIVWAASVCKKARKEGRIRDDISLYQLMKQLCVFRNFAQNLLSYDWICIPLVYTQVATLCTYLYFLTCLFAKQLLTSPDTIDIYIPIFHFLEFFFFMGWLKVAETMINPFGADDDDFEVNWLIDRNITVSYMIVDEMHADFPEMVKDAYWDGVVPEELPYTIEALKFKTDGMGQGSANKARDDTKSKLDEHAADGRSQIEQHRFSFPFHFHIFDDKRSKHDNAASEAVENPKIEGGTLFEPKLPVTVQLFEPPVMDQAMFQSLLDRSFVPKTSDSDEDLLKSPHVQEEEPDQYKYKEAESEQYDMVADDTEEYVEQDTKNKPYSVTNIERGQPPETDTQKVHFAESNSEKGSQPPPPPSPEQKSDSQPKADKEHSDDEGDGDMY